MPCKTAGSRRKRHAEEANGVSMLARDPTTPHSKDSRLEIVYVQSGLLCQEGAGGWHGPVTFRMGIVAAWATAEGVPRADKWTKGKSD